MTIPERIADARQKLAKATPLPWEEVGLTLRVSGRGVILRSPTPDNGGVFDCSPNISYAGVAVNGFPALAAEVERLGKVLDSDNQLLAQEQHEVARLERVIEADRVALNEWVRFASECRRRNITVPLWAAMINERAVQLTEAALAAGKPKGEHA